MDIAPKKLHTHQDKPDLLRMIDDAASQLGSQASKRSQLNETRNYNSMNTAAMVLNMDRKSMNSSIRAGQ